MNEINQVDLNLLKSLQALIIERHVGRAAQRMNVTQPAMSHTLARLRRLLDDPLFVKNGRELAMTTRTKELSNRLNMVLAEIAILVAPVELCLETVEAVIRIHTHDFVATSFLAPIFQRIRRQAPGITFDVQTYSMESNHQLDVGEADLIIGSGLHASPKFLQKLLTREHLMCLLDKDHPALKCWTSENLFLYPHIQTSLWDNKDHPIHVYGKMHGLPERKIGLTTGSLHLQPSFLPGATLIAFLPSALAKQAAENGELIARICPFDLPAFGIRSIWHERDQKSPLHMWIRNQLAM